ncbi:MAG: hypothetical protein HYZ75_12590 [Elusimicrobia bacterium]|nr:hypothetical protein [Elusimicrobiota bacterium]
MKNPLSLLLLGGLLAQSSWAAHVVGPAGAGMGGSFTPAAAAGAAAALSGFFASPAPNLTSLRPFLPSLHVLDLADPVVRAAARPVTAALRAEARGFLDAEALTAAPVRSGDAAARAEKLALLSHPLVAAHLAPEDRPLIAEAARAAREQLTEGRRAKLDSRLRAVAAALENPVSDGGLQILAVIPSPLPPSRTPRLRPAAQDEVFLMQVRLDEKGRSGTGYEESKAVEALAARYPGKVKVLDADGASSLFQSNFAVEVDASVRDEVLLELAAIEGLETHAMAALTAAAARREPGAPLDAALLAALKGRFVQGTMLERMIAFAELASALEAAAPERVAALPEPLRDEALRELHAAAGLMVNSYNLVRGDARRGLREAALKARGDGDFDYAAFERSLQIALTDPAMKARFEPLRVLTTRALRAMDKLDTPAARAQVLELLPHADSAGFELVASEPALKARYVRAWLGLVLDSVSETVAGFQLASRPKEWTGMSRGRGYAHIDASRNSRHLYLWKPYRSDPGEMRHELALMLGLSDPDLPLVRMILLALDSVQWRIPEIDALNREEQVARELKNRLGNLDYYAQQAAEQGRPWPPERLEELRRDAREQAEGQYDERERIEGHNVIDRLLASLVYSPYHMFTPGFDETEYVSSVLELLHDAHVELSEPGLVKELVDTAVSFLVSIVGEPLLGARPELRYQAQSLWELVSAKAAGLGLPLITKLDGVIVRRPEVLPSVEPRHLAGGVDRRSGETIWQASESPDGRYVARAGADRKVLVWERATGRLVKTITLEDARQSYGDLANSLGAGWTAEGKLLVTTLHDREGLHSGKGSFNLVRAFDVDGAEGALGPADAASSAEVDGVYVIRHMPQGPNGQYLAAGVELRGDDRAYLGAETRFFALDGRELARIPEAVLLDAQDGLTLTAKPAKSVPGMALWDTSDPAAPRDATPTWMREWNASWQARSRAKVSYGWWPAPEARLASVAGRPAVMIHDAGSFGFFDLETGRKLQSLEVPHGWKPEPFLSDAAGAYAAAVVSAHGRFGGRRPQRLMVWDLSTGEILIEVETEDLQQLSFSADGRRAVVAGKGGVSLFELPAPAT